MISYYLTSLGVIPYFASRAFLPLFTTALLGRFGLEITPLAKYAGIQLLSTLPGWATSNFALLVLGILALLEIVAAKIPEVRDLLSLTDTQLKGAAAFLLCFAIVQGDPNEIVQHVKSVGLTTQFVPGQSLAYVWSFVIGVIVWFTAVMRNSIFEFLRDIDEDDDLGIQGFLSWVEDGIGVFGMLFVVVFPVLALILVVLTLLGLWLTRRYLEKRDEKKKVACSNCGALNPLCGIGCSSCRQQRPEIFQVGVLGSIKDLTTDDLHRHRLQLLSGRRCNFCGNRLSERRIAQHCKSCGTKPFDSSEAVEEYLSSLRATLPRTLGVLLVMSAVPLIGLVPGVIYYRLSLISSLRCYVPRSVGFMARWVIRLISLLLFGLQPFPLVGSLALPILCWLNFTIYQSLLRRQARANFRPGLNP